MNLSFNQQQNAIVELARDFARRELAPSVQLRDENSIIDPHLYQQATNLGLCAIPFPTSYGGMGLDYTSFVLACEQLCQVDDGFGFSLAATTMLFAWPIFAYGTQTQKKRMLQDVCVHNKMGALCITEPESGSNAARQHTRATAQGNGYILNGCKVMISNAPLADYYLVLAATSPDGSELSAFVLEKGMPGLTFGPVERKLGCRTLPTAMVIMQNVRVDKQNMLGQTGQGLKIIMETVLGGRLCVSAQGLGLCQGALEHSLKHSKTRLQFGRPLAANQAVQFMLADMATLTEALRLMVYRLAWMKDNNMPYASEASMCKLFAAEAAMRVTIDATQLFGGYGYLADYPVERLMRNAKMLAFAGGTSQVQRMIISHHLLHAN